MASLICDTFEKVSADRRHEIAIYALSGGSTWTFAEVGRAYREIAQALARLLPASSCVVSHVGNDPSFLPLFLACLDRGASIVLLDGGMTDSEVSAVAGRFSAQAIVRMAPGPAAADWTALTGGLVLIRREDVQPAPWQPAGPAVLKLTSGSSAEPKAVLASELNLVRDGEHIVEVMQISPADVNLGVISMAHAYGLGNLVMPLLLQGTPVALREGFVGQLASDIETSGATVFPGVPFMFDHLLRTEAPLSPIARLRLIITAGAPIEFETVRLFKETFGKKLHSLYGTSETGSICFDASEEITEPVTVGRPLPGTTVSLVASPAAALGEGRVHVEGDAVAAGYAQADADVNSLTAFTDGGFLTGDFGRFEEGRLFLTGRASPFVNVAGRKVHPEEVERVIRALEGIAEVSVFGMPDPVRGESLVACVRRLSPSVSVAAIRAACADRLAPHKIPRRIVFTEDMPTDARGKISRRTLEAMVSVGREPI